MKIIKYSEEWKERWDKFVEESNNGTLFHLQKFFDYHAKGKFSFDHLIFLENEQIIALLPGAIKGNKFESPIGASYGSIVTKDIKFEKALEIVSTLLDYAKVNEISEFELTAAPVVYEDKPNQNLDFAMLWLGFKYSLHYISSAIKLNKDEDIISRFQPTVRRNIRKTFRDSDIRVEINERYDQFYPILLDNKARHNVKPTHSLEELMRLKELLPNHLKLFMLYYKDKPIAGSSMFFVNKTCALCFYNMLDYEYEHLKPIHRIMYEVVKYSTDNGYSYVDIGVSQDTKAENPMTPSMGLIDFKEKFDAKTVMRNTLSIKL
ncbi:MAG: GNAT family N-acetyltransferase [Bacteroidetes bacterium]|nr:GNAT family N-acetyltransferase [Bacteroidota bacterium]MBU1115815.1 GNAT family N-acetyltransferase [Bacteroidota bacterium]MBU1800208.1 GNAT family N-acetyltransferase [Bacteroidota bacterium]